MTVADKHCWQIECEVMVIMLHTLEGRSQGSGDVTRLCQWPCILV